MTATSAYPHLPTPFFPYGIAIYLAAVLVLCSPYQPAHGEPDIPISPRYAVGSPIDYINLFFDRIDTQNTGAHSREDQRKVDVTNAVNNLINAFENARDERIKAILQGALEQAKPRMSDVGLLLEHDLYDDSYSIRSVSPDAAGLWYAHTDRWGIVILAEGQDMEDYVSERSACEETGIHRYDVVTGNCDFLWDSIQMYALIFVLISLAEFVIIILLASYMVVRRRSSSSSS